MIPTVMDASQTFGESQINPSFGVDLPVQDAREVQQLMARHSRTTKPSFFGVAHSRTENEIQAIVKILVI